MSLLDKLPTSLLHHVLLEWLSPKSVCVLARAGSTRVRKTVATTPCSFRAAKGEWINPGTIFWFHERVPIPLVLNLDVQRGVQRGINVRWDKEWAKTTTHWGWSEPTERTRLLPTEEEETAPLVMTEPWRFVERTIAGLLHSYFRA